VDGNWDAVGAWSNGGLPGSTDDVQNNTIFTITHDAGNDTINSLLTEGKFILSGGSLTINTTLNISTALLANNSFTISGGATLADASVTNSNLLVVTNGVLDSVTLDKGLNLNNGGEVFLLNSFNAGGTVQMTNGSTVFYEGNLLVSNNVTLGNTSSSGSLYTGYPSSSNSSGLTAGHTISGQGTLYNYGNFTNDGTINANIASGTLTVETPSATFTNASDGILEASNVGTLNLLSTNTLANNGTIEALANSTLSLSPTNWTKVGTVEANGSGAILQIGGTFSLGSGDHLEALNGGQVQLTGTLTNTSSTFDPTTIPQDSSSSFEVAGGTITGGNITNSAKLMFGSGSSELQNLSTDGGLTLGNSSGSVTLDTVTLAGALNVNNGGEVFLLNSFSAPGTISVTNGSIVFYEGNLLVSNSVTLGNMSTTGTLYTGYSSSSNSSGLTSGHTISGQGTLYNYGNFTNDGTVNASISSSTLYVETPSSTFTNASDGLVEASNGGTLNLLSTNTLANNGTIEALANSTLSLSPTSWTAFGTVEANGSGAILQIGGTLSLGSGDHLEALNGGQVQLTGTLNNAGSTFDPTTIPQDNSSSFVVNAGTIQGGNIINSTSLVFQGSGTLDSVSLDKGLTLTNGSNVYLLNSFTSSGALTVNNDSSVFYEGNLQINNSVTLGNTSTTGTLYTGYSSSNNSSGLTAGHTISGQGELYNYGSFTNDGTINANLSGETLTVETPTGGTTFTNASDGTLEATNSGNLSISSNGATALANAGTIQAAASSNIATNSNITQTSGSTEIDGTLNLNSSSGTFNIQGGSLSGIGTILGHVSNAGHVHPGDAPGTLSISGNYTQTSVGNFDLDLAGSPTSGLFGHLNVGGNASLAGTLNVNLLNNYLPVVNTTYDILDYGTGSGGGTLSGQFATLNGMTSNFAYTISYNTPNQVLLRVTNGAPAVPGPDSLVVLGIGLAGVGVRLRRRRVQA
jgi:hypothetical protein